MSRFTASFAAPGVVLHDGGGLHRRRCLEDALRDGRHTGAGGGGGGAALGSILLGDFEDHTAKPQDHRFKNYWYYAYNPNEGLPAGAFVNRRSWPVTTATTGSG